MSAGPQQPDGDSTRGGGGGVRLWGGGCCPTISAVVDRECGRCGGRSSASPGGVVEAERDEGEESGFLSMLLLPLF